MTQTGSTLETSKLAQPRNNERRGVAGIFAEESIAPVKELNGF